MEVTIIIVILVILLGWKAYKVYNSWEHTLARQLRKEGIKAEVKRLPDGKTLADVLEELLGENDNE